MEQAECGVGRLTRRVSGHILVGAEVSGVRAADRDNLPMLGSTSHMRFNLCLMEAATRPGMSDGMMLRRYDPPQCHALGPGR